MTRKILLGLFALLVAGSGGIKSVSADETKKNKFAEVADSLPVSPGDAVAAKEKSDLDPVAVIRHALTKKVSWDFKEKALEDIVEALEKELKIPIRLDIKAMNDLGVTPEVTMNFKISDVSAKTAFNHLLRDLGLALCIQDEVLSITSPDTADNTLYTEFYNVADMPYYRRANGKTVPNYEKLMEIITLSIKPTMWDDVGGQGSILEYDAADTQILVVSQTWEVHEKIQQLLDRLRTLRQWPLDKEIVEKLPPEPPATPKRQPVPHGMGMMMGGMGGAAGPGTATPPASTPPTANPSANNPPAANPAPNGPAQATPPGPGQGMGMF